MNTNAAHIASLCARHPASGRRNCTVGGIDGLCSRSIILAPRERRRFTRCNVSQSECSVIYFPFVRLCSPFLGRLASFAYAFLIFVLVEVPAFPGQISGDIGQLFRGCHPLAKIPGVEMAPLRALLVQR